MEEPTYHGEITNISPNRRQTLSLDIMCRPHGDGRCPVLSLSVWHDDDYDPAAEIDLTPASARILAQNLQAAADLVDGHPAGEGIVDEDSDDDACKGKLTPDDLRLLPLVRQAGSAVLHRQERADHDAA